MNSERERRIGTSDGCPNSSGMSGGRTGAGQGGADNMNLNGRSRDDGANGSRGISRENGSHRSLSADKLDAIRELSFVKTELELYLDTHPSCKVALDYYHKTVDALAKLMAEYQTQGAPIVASGSVDPESWRWVGEPWPWQRVSDMAREER